MQKVGLLTHRWCQTKQIPVDYFQSVDSTSSFAKTLMADPLENHHSLHVVISEHQDAGRGRGLNSWINGEPGSCLLTTWSFRLTRPPQPVTSIRVGLGLYSAASKVWPDVPFSLKAPNDLYLGNQKIAGLLLEAIEQGPHIRLLIGLGINVVGSPSLNTAADLKSHISEDLIEGNWDYFLDELYQEFQNACHQVSYELSSIDLKRLVEALNRYPGLESPYTQVDPSGNLWQGNKKINWFEL